MELIRGIVAAPVLPMTEDFEVDWKGLRELPPVARAPGPDRDRDEHGRRRGACALRRGAPPRGRGVAGGGGGALPGVERSHRGLDEGGRPAGAGPRPGRRGGARGLPARAHLHGGAAPVAAAVRVPPGDRRGGGAAALPLPVRPGARPVLLERGALPAGRDPRGGRDEGGHLRRRAAGRHAPGAPGRAEAARRPDRQRHLPLRGVHPRRARGAHRLRRDRARSPGQDVRGRPAEATTSRRWPSGTASAPWRG